MDQNQLNHYLYYYYYYYYICLAALFHNALVGRFNTGRPPMEVVHKFFMTLGLKGSCSVGLLDAKHVLI